MSSLTRGFGRIFESLQSCSRQYPLVSSQFQQAPSHKQLQLRARRSLRPVRVEAAVEVEERQEEAGSRALHLEEECSQEVEASDLEEDPMTQEAMEEDQEVEAILATYPRLGLSKLQLLLRQAEDRTILIETGEEKMMTRMIDPEGPASKRRT